MKEILCIVNKPYSYCEELKEYIVDSTIYKELGFKPTANIKNMRALLNDEEAGYLVCIADPRVARKLKLELDSEDIRVKLILVLNSEETVLHAATKDKADILAVSAIERLSVKGLSELLKDTRVDIILDGKSSFKKVTNQFDDYLITGNPLEAREDDGLDEVLEDVKHGTGDIVYKCALLESQARSLVEKGMSKFEIHTDDRFLCDPDPIKFASEFLDIFPDIVTVHTPLDITMSVMTRPSCTIGQIANDRDMYRAVKNTMEFAQACADKYEHRVGIVMHNDHMTDELFVWNDSKKLRKVFKKLLKKYPDVDIYIENTTPMEPRTSINDITFHGGTFEDVPMIAHILNTGLCEDSQKRFYLCLDTCHLMCAMRVYKTLGLPNKYSMEDIFQIYGVNTKQLHLAYCKNFGVKMNEHGIGFQGNISVLRSFLCYIDKYMPEADIVLEMKEDDYHNPINSVEAANFINKFRND